MIKRSEINPFISINSVASTLERTALFIICFLGHLFGIGSKLQNCTGFFLYLLLFWKIMFQKFQTWSKVNKIRVVRTFQILTEFCTKTPKKNLFKLQETLLSLYSVKLLCFEELSSKFDLFLLRVKPNPVPIPLKTNFELKYNLRFSLYNVLHFFSDHCIDDT